jgi:hypothetical protein
MKEVYQCWWRICSEINVFSRFEYHVFYILHSFVTYLLTLVYIVMCIARENTLRLNTRTQQ